MLTIGPHISSAKGYLSMGQHALELGATTLAFFTRNPRGGLAKAIDGADVMAFRELAAKNSIGPVVAHGAYTLNACSAKESVREFTAMTMRDDLARMEHTPDQLYNFHPGGHGGQGLEVGVAYIADLLNELLTPEMHMTVLLETMTGKGSEVGGSFEELQRILERVTLTDKVGICLDTCHVWDAGYDIQGDLDGVLTDFDRAIGLKRLKAVHLNDSMNERGSRKDRHARHGEGCIGLEAIGRIINHEALRGLPFILETPNEDEGWAREIVTLRDLYTG